MLDLINQKIDGNLWEELCTKCYRMRYQSEGFHPVPAAYRGDHGIEGYTHTGIVYQCYFPEKEYSDDELYKSQRDKMTRDIKKFLENGEGLKSIGVENVKEWHFVVPTYKDRRILEHRTTKQREVRKKKKENDLDYINENFCIFIKTEDDFFEELAKVINVGNALKYDISFQHTGEIDWSKCDSDKVDNIKRKIKAIMTGKDALLSEEPYKRLVNLYVSFYMKGIEILNTLRLKSPILYEQITKISYSFRTHAQMKCDFNTDRTLNKEIFEEILKEFEERLNEAFSDTMTRPSIAELKNDLISSWLADCPMDFR
ncbi:hypothetical protein OF830_28345 [Bacillus paramycoides]|uniref:hypothetical protein n=1 Tax=Bacillus paramycoides TaxID=2026194 RepID=UPI0022444DCA|nr:hypothetical protein [Bacillus paramycoides]MCW9134662.1 hypothetical protein [Bacillus paramycoides]